MAAITNHKEPPSGVFSSRTVAIIPAGGVGRRMDSPLPKQYLPLGGVPLLVHTLRCFEYSPSIDLVVLVVPGEDVPWVEEEIVGLFNLQKVKKVVAGGTQRQDSVRNGLMNLEGWEELVVVHDGVRPFVSPTLIERCLELARRFGAAIPGVPASDTVKECRDGVV
ncbi:MAG: 2-C-methyl-D-erythritol 4-phosphate cytidylyltransferase, partial [Syntrophales bacterium]|nr:2-C-methyl-D-erythritol 4-phosphate cytidylyltransferase [Syntrophales bacterium]